MNKKFFIKHPGSLCWQEESKVMWTFKLDCASRYPASWEGFQFLRVE